MADSEPQPSKYNQIKRLIVFCDGTGQASSTGHSPVPTNVTRFARALDTSCIRRGCDEIPQIVLYQTGVGASGTSKLADLLGGAFGVGVDEHILEAYTFIANNYEVGDDIFLFGFSRGAFTARAIASLICNAGLLAKEKLPYLPMIYKQYKARDNSKEGRENFDDWVEQRKDIFKLYEDVTIRVLGVWDTVGSIGVPETWISSRLGLSHFRKWWNRSYGYHDTSLPERKRNNWRAYVARAYQALSLEENRISFEPIPFRFPVLPERSDLSSQGGSYIQCWFPGVHTDVGGGYERAYHDISDISLTWMMDMCGELAFDSEFKNELKKKSLKLVDPSLSPADLRELEAKALRNDGPPHDNGWAMSETHDELKSLKFWLGGSANRKPGQYYLGQEVDDNGKSFLTNEFIHASVRMRMLKTKSGGSQWKPPALDGFQLKQESQLNLLTWKQEEVWNWNKTIKLPDGKSQTITLPEWMPAEQSWRDQNMECCVLTPDDLKPLDDKDACNDLEMVEIKRRSWLTWAIAFTVTLGAAGFLVHYMYLEGKFPF